MFNELTSSINLLGRFAVILSLPEHPPLLRRQLLPNLVLDQVDQTLKTLPVDDQRRHALNQALSHAHLGCAQSVHVCEYQLDELHCLGARAAQVDKALEIALQIQVLLEEAEQDFEEFTALGHVHEMASHLGNFHLQLGRSLRRPVRRLAQLDYRLHELIQQHAVLHDLDEGEDREIVEGGEGSIESWK